MNEAQKLFEEIHAHAVRRGWESVVEICDSFVSDQKPTVILGSAGAIDAEMVRAWLQAQLGAATTVRLFSLRELAKRPYLALQAEYVVGIFPGDALPEPGDLQYFRELQELEDGTATAAVVITNNRARSEEDRNVEITFAWNFFSPAPRTRWKGESLATGGIFLWASSETATEDLAVLTASLRDKSVKSCGPHEHTTAYILQVAAAAHEGGAREKRPATRDTSNEDDELLRVSLSEDARTMVNAFENTMRIQMSEVRQRCLTYIDGANFATDATGDVTRECQRLEEILVTADEDVTDSYELVKTGWAETVQRMTLHFDRRSAAAQSGAARSSSEKTDNILATSLPLRCPAVLSTDLRSAAARGRDTGRSTERSRWTGSCAGAVIGAGIGGKVGVFAAPVGIFIGAALGGLAGAKSAEGYARRTTGREQVKTALKQAVTTQLNAFETQSLEFCRTLRTNLAEQIQACFEKLAETRAAAHGSEVAAAATRTADEAILAEWQRRHKALLIAR